MTREEAIDLLDNLIGMVEDNHCSDYDTALRMGIKALQESCEDAISREDVINLKWQGEASEEFLEGYASAIEDARVLPSVNPQEPKTGHWIEHPEIETSTPEYLMFYECSECGDKQCFCKSDIHKKHFCNNCGARMVEPTCDTCEYTTAAFNPCNACKDKSEYKPQERSDKK